MLLLGILHYLAKSVNVDVFTIHKRLYKYNIWNFICWLQSWWSFVKGKLAPFHKAMCIAGAVCADLAPKGIWGATNRDLTINYKRSLGQAEIRSPLKSKRLAAEMSKQS